MANDKETNKGKTTIQPPKHAKVEKGEKGTTYTSTKKGEIMIVYIPNQQQ